MLKMRVIPCLDVKDGRVVKGVNFVDLRRCRRPGRAGAVLRPRGRRRTVLPRHHRQSRGPRHALRRGAPHRRAMLHAADRRRRRAHGRGHPPAAARRRRQGVDQHRRGRRAPNSCARRRGNSAASASSWRSTPSGAGAERWEVFTHGGRRPTGLDAVEWAVPAGRLRRRRDPADLDGPRRHQAWASTSR